MNFCRLAISCGITSRPAAGIRPSCILTFCIRALVILVLCSLALESVATACPVCKEALQNSTGNDRSTNAYETSILLMMAMPFAIFSVLGGLFYWQVRQASPMTGPQPEALPPGQDEDPLSS